MVVNPFKLEVKVNGELKTISMPFARLNRIVRLVGGPDRLPVLASDPDVQEQVIIELFTIREKGEIKESVALDDIELTPEEGSRIINWVGDHILDFFLRTTEGATKAVENNQEKLSRLTATATGLQNLVSKNPAA